MPNEQVQFTSSSSMVAIQLAVFVSFHTTSLDGNADVVIYLRPRRGCLAEPDFSPAVYESLVS